MRQKQALWIVNHKTLLPAEVPILQSLGYGIFIPKIIPQVPDYRSAVVDHSFDATLNLKPYELKLLNEHPMYSRAWAPSVTEVLNEHFSVLITSVSAFTTPLFEAIRKFEGLIVARVFGREHPRRYTEFFDLPSGRGMMQMLEQVGSRFVFGQGFDNLCEVEAAPLRDRAHTLAVAVPPWVWERAGTWVGDQAVALFLCPNIKDSGHYAAIYHSIKANFGDLPHRIFGRQNIPPDDDLVLPYMTDAELLFLYGRARVFVYPSDQPRHLHYSPIEAMIVGTPVLFLRGGMLHFLGGDDQPGLCNDLAGMKSKARSLLQGNTDLAEAIRDRQRAIVDTFAPELARRQWEEILPA